jgi:predicted Zn-dependent protease
MRFENRAPDETVNYSIEHPLKEFAWLVGGVLGTLIIATLLIGFFAGELAARMPYRYERDLAAGIEHQLKEQDKSPQHLAVEQELNRLASRLVAHMDLPEGMQVTVHFDDTPDTNAYATLGAHIVVLQGLLARMPDENALAMVLAHEIAHAKLRHPARSLGRGVAVGIILSAISAGMGKSAAGGVVTRTGGLSLLKFSRDQEREADAEALGAIVALYGHAGGAQDVFRILQEASGSSENSRITMLSTHPLSPERIESIDRLATDHGWTLEGARTPFAAAVKAAASIKPELAN